MYTIEKNLTKLEIQGYTYFLDPKAFKDIRSKSSLLSL